MTTYTCKCGKRFEGRGDSVTTGYRIPRLEYTPEHGCFGCPFVKGVNAEFVECRGTRNTPIYGTTASCVASKASTLHVSSLDFDFIRDMQDFYNSLGAEGPKDPPEPGMEDSSGRLQFSFTFPKNSKGEKAKRQLIERFFESVQNKDTYREIFGRKDVSGCYEQYDLYDKISAAKRQAKAAAGQQPVKTEEAQHIVTQYQHHDKVYLVQECEDGKFRAYFYYLANPANLIAVGDITKCDAAWIAQKMLDEYAERRGFAVYGADGEEQSEPEQQTIAENLEENNDTVPSSDDSADMEQADESPDADNSEDDLENGSDASDNASCSWQNASGSEDDSHDSEDLDEISGEPLDLRGEEFDYIIAPANAALNHFVAMLHAKKQHDGEINIKVTFEDIGGKFNFNGAVSGKINLAMKPRKVVGDAVELLFDAAGNPIIPYDREHQMTFDEVPPTPPVVTQVDGSTGLVESVAVGEEWEPPTSDDITNDILRDEDNPAPASESSLHPCSNSDCPFYAIGVDEDSGCCFDDESPDSNNYAGDVWEAVHMHNCQREEVLHAYRLNDPENEVDEEEYVS